jgi:hypothetical protein
LLLAKDWNYWKEAILNDLARAHPDIRQCVAHIDIMRIGHAMARPSPGIPVLRRKRAMVEAGRQHLSSRNSDLSGFSIFEEAQYRGVEAARRPSKAYRSTRASAIVNSDSPTEKTSSLPVATSDRNWRRKASASSRFIDCVRTLIANADVSSAIVSRETRIWLAAPLTILSTAGVPSSG